MLFWLVDPELGRHDRRTWPAAEPLGVVVVGGGERVLPGLVDRAGGTEVDRGRGVPGDPGMPVNVLYSWKKPAQNWRARASEAKDAGNSGRYFRVLNCASENGLSLLTRGRECERVTPRSVSSADTGLDVIDVPRSACTVCGAVPLRSMASSMKSFASWESSTGEMIQDGLNRE